MGTNYKDYNIKDYFAEKRGYPPINVCEPHMPVLLLLDLSGSIGRNIKLIEASVNRFKEDICKDAKAAERVDVCVIGFNDTIHLLQDWAPITEMKNVELWSSGGTNMSEGLEVAVNKLIERTNEYKKVGIPEIKMPFLIMLTDGMGNNIDEIAATIRKRTKEGMVRPWFLGFGEYDKVTASKITDGERVFEVKDENGYDFTGFFDIMKVSIKAVSTSAPGATPIIKPEDNPLRKEDCSVQVAKVDKWLAGE